MNMNETVAGLTITAKTEGVDQAKKQVDGLTQSTEQLGVASQQTSKSTLSLEDAWKKQTLRLDEAARAQANMARETKIADGMLREAKITAEQHAERLNLISQRYGQASAAQKAFAAATSGVSAQLVALSAGAGPVGTFLAALGPWGMAASVGIGAVASVFDHLSEGAKRVGDKSIELKKFSDVTGLSVTEIKGLTKAGAELGVSSDAITTSVEHFSVGLHEARKGAGELFEQVAKINPQLARQLAEAKGTAQAWDILAQAIKSATDETQRNALARAAFRRGGIETGLVAAATVDKGGVAAMGDQIAKNTGLTKEWVAETKTLRAENIALEKQYTATTEALFAVPMLQLQNEALKARKALLGEIINYGKRWQEAVSAPFTQSPTFDERFPLSQRGPSEGAMQAQTEAQAQREVTQAIQEANKAREDAVSLERMRQTITLDTLATEKRKAEVFAQNAQTYSNVSATTAQTLAAMKDQLDVASAVGVRAQMEAQHRATINQLLREGKSLTDATAVADEQRAIALAKIASAHEVTMVSLRGQLAVAQETTGLGKINAQYHANINNLKLQGLSSEQATAEATVRRKTALAEVNASAERTLGTMQNELEVLKAESEEDKARILARQEYNKLIEQGVDKELAGAIAAQMMAKAREQQLQREVQLQEQQEQQNQANAQAELQRAVALAQVNTAADQQLKTLQQQGELIRASSEWEKGRIQAAQEYLNLLEKGVDAQRAGAIAAQMQANARDTQLRSEEKDEEQRRKQNEDDNKRFWEQKNQQSEKESQQQAELFDLAEQRANAYIRAADAAEREAVALRDAADTAIDLERAIKGFVPFALSAAFGVGSGGGSIGGQTWTDSSGRLTQFNPAGYTSSYNPIPPALLDSIYGAGGYNPVTFAPNAQGREFQFNKAVARGGLASAVGGMLSQGVLTEGALGAPPVVDQDRMGLLQRGIGLLPPEQQIGATRQLIGQLESAPSSLATLELIKQLNDQLEQLTKATDANTSATSAMTDVLSPFYSSDPRRTHLGFRAFAGGGIMTQYGELPLRQYQGGGMATSPQVAVFGEGSTPEAYVPVPSGRIPVELKTPANSNQRPVNVTINVMGNADAGTVAALKQTSFQKAQQLRRITG